MKKTIRVAAAAIITKGKLLIAQRPYSDCSYKSLKWEFPGGKIEAGETVTQALKREIREELDCNIEIEKMLPEMEYEYPDFFLQMTICICSLKENEVPRALEHNAILFVGSDELRTVDWAPADACCYQRVLPFIPKQV